MKEQKNFKMLGLTKQSWVEYGIDDKCLMHWIKCKICTSMEKKGKAPNSKFK